MVVRIAPRTPKVSPMIASSLSLVPDCFEISDVEVVVGPVIVGDVFVEGELVDDIGPFDLVADADTGDVDRGLSPAEDPAERRDCESPVASVADDCTGPADVKAMY